MIKIPIASEAGKGMGCIRVPSTPLVAQSDIITRHFRGKFLARAEPKPSSENVEWIEYTYFNSIGVDILTESSEIAQNITDVDWADLKVLADTLSIRQHNADDGDTLRVAAKEFALPRWNEERNCFRYCHDPVTNQKHLVVMWGIFEKSYGPPIRTSASPTETCEPTIIHTSRGSTPPPLTPGPIGPTYPHPTPNPTKGLEWAWLVLGALLILLLMLLLRSCVDGNLFSKPAPSHGKPQTSSPAPSLISHSIDKQSPTPLTQPGLDYDEPINWPVETGATSKSTTMLSDAMTASQSTDSAQGSDQSGNDNTNITKSAVEPVTNSIIENTESNSVVRFGNENSALNNKAETRHDEVIALTAADHLAFTVATEVKSIPRIKHKWTMVDGPPLANDPGEERLPPELQSGSITSGYVKVRLNHEVYDENDELIITQEIDWIYERE